MKGLLLAASGADIDMSKYFEFFNSDMSLGKAALIAVLGISVVLVILLVLVGLLTVFEKIFSSLSKKSEAKSKQTANAVSAEDESDEETVAAIVAAVTMLYAEDCGEDSVPPFVVRRIKQVSQLNSKR
ncbi:MAG: hypothetical protein HFE48_04215 [Clostridia bacterium]|nr:hypothetical protein [Clostridia bacterium]